MKTKLKRIPVSREEFLEVVKTSRTFADAARTLGCSFQSVKARLDRIRLRNGRNDSRDMRKLDDKALEEAWNEAHDNRDTVRADDCFAEMCRRLESR